MNAEIKALCYLVAFADSSTVAKAFSYLEPEELFQIIDALDLAEENLHVSSFAARLNDIVKSYR